MRALFLTSTLPRFCGDMQAPFVLEQAQAWKAKRPHDRVIVLAPHDKAAARCEMFGEVEVRRFRYLRPEGLQALAYPAILPNLKRNPLLAIQLVPFILCAYAAARRIVEDEKIDLVYAHWVMPQGIIAALLKASTRVPYILQNHSSDLSVFNKLDGLGRALARKILSGAAAFFCVNSRQRDFACSLLPGLGCTVLPMGVSYELKPEETSIDPTDYRYALGVISRLSRKKGLGHLIAAAEMLASRGRRIPIGIAGDGEDAEELARLPKQADVHFTGFLSGRDKDDFFDSCFAFVFPSISIGGDVEGMPVSLLEAMVAGKLIIASRMTNIELLPEWPDIQDSIELLDDLSDTGAFVRAIERLIDLSPDQIAARSQHLRQTMARYRWNRLIGEYLEVIDGVTDQTGMVVP